MQVTAHIDAVTIEHDVEPSEKARKVYALRNERLAPYTMSAGGAKSSNRRQKHYTYTITVPGIGCIACVALESGCKNMPHDQQHQLWWHQRFEEFGLPVPEKYADPTQHTGFKV